MKVIDAMSTNPQSVGINEFITRAREIMRNFDYESLPVIDNGRVAGMITLSDVINVTSTKSDVTVDGYVRFEVPTVKPDMDLATAARILLGTDVGRVPVVDENRRLVGLLSIKDLFKSISELGFMDGPVIDHMTKKVIVCQPEDSLSRVWRNMIEYDLTGFPVVNLKQEVIGMITRRDVLNKGYVRVERESESQGGKTSTTVQYAMSTPAITVDEGDTLKKVAKIFIEHNIGRVPVVKNNRLVGIIDRYDVIRACRKLQEVVK